MKQPKLTLILAIAMIAFFGSCRKDAANFPQSSNGKDVFGASCATPTNNPPPPPVTIVYCGSTEVPLVSGQTNVGTVTVGNDGTNLYVTFTLSGNYKTKKTRLYVGSLAGLPVSNNGNAAISQFPYQTSHHSGVTTFTYTIPLATIGTNCYVVAAYAELNKKNHGGNEEDDNNDDDGNYSDDDHGDNHNEGHNKAAWGQGTLINTSTTCNNNNGAMYISWCNVTCGGSEDPGK